MYQLDLFRVTVTGLNQIKLKRESVFMIANRVRV